MHQFRENTNDHCALNNDIRSMLHTGTCRAVFWMGVVRVVMPVGLCMVDSTCVPSGLSVVRTNESVFRI